MNRTAFWFTILFVAIIVALPAIDLVRQDDTLKAAKQYFRLGIDLQGGTSLVYEVGGSSGGEKMDEIIRVLRDRVDPTGTKNYAINKRVGSNRIEVVMAGVDPEEVQTVKRLLGRNGRLTFRLLADPEDVPNFEELAQRRAQGVRERLDKYEWVPLKYNSKLNWDKAALFLNLTDRFGQPIVTRDEAMAMHVTPKYDASVPGGAKGVAIFVIHPTGGGGEMDIRTTVIGDEAEQGKEPSAPQDEGTATDTAKGGQGAAELADIEVLIRRDTPLVEGEDFSRTQKDDRDGRPIVYFQMKPSARANLRGLTGPNQGKRMAIVLDGKVTSAPTIKAELDSGGIIEGYDSPEERDEVLTVLQSGTLNVDLRLLSERQIGPELGEDNINRGLNASLLALVAVVVFMAIYYLGAGLVADIAVILNLIIIVVIMYAMKGVWTLPGIAGLILTVGMSVDANVLIFERIREELERGSSIRLAVRNGYSRALPAIFDGNLTTFLTGIILAWVGSPEVKGFAIVLCIGLATSMFTALWVTRAVFDLLLGAGLLRKMRMMPRLVKAGQIRFTKIARPAFAVSVILVLAGIAGSVYVGESKYAMEFRGGTSVELNFSEAVEIETVRQRVAGLDSGTVAILRLKDAVDLESVREQVVGLSPEYADAIVIALADEDNEVTGHRYRIQVFSNDAAKVAADLKKAFSTSGEPDARPATSLSMGYSSAVVQPIKYKDDEFADRRYAIRVLSSDDEVVKETLRQRFKEALAKTSQLQVKVDAKVLNKDMVLEMQNRGLPADEASAGKLILNEYLKYVGAIQATIDLVGEESRVQEIAKRVDEYLKNQEPDKASVPREILPYPGAVKGPKGYAKFLVYIYDQRLGTTDQAVVERMREAWQLALRNGIAKAPALISTKIDQSIGNESKIQAIIAAGLSLGVIILYIWFRFARVSYGLAAVLALVHDVSIVLGMVILFSWFGRNIPFIGEMKIDLPMIGAFLTLIGYSLNDTIVVFDRIRENRGKFGELSETVIDNSINQTMTRTILTSFTTFIVVFILYMLAGEQSAVHGFAFVLLFGVAWGTYSSIVIASPLLLWLRKRKATVSVSGGSPSK
ncbi:MAG: protein translocase subunit SecD [Planctomycetes bacterium]|nr:protein translocase subunit SecD [Planctomycetota bacterium]